MRPYIFLFLLLTGAGRLSAQPVLPDMTGTSSQGTNTLFWTAQYDGIKSIAVLRSTDSLMNFATIGFVRNLKKGPQEYTDARPMPGNNYYKLEIIFNSGLNWTSNTYRMHIDSAELYRIRTSGAVSDTEITMRPGGNSTGRPVGRGAAGSAPAGTPTLPGPRTGTEVDPAAYIRSKYVFSNPFTGHVNIEIPDAKEQDYSILFFDQYNRMVLEVPRIPGNTIIMDKRNFQRKGLYRFELSRKGIRIETGYINVY